jgi:proteic killer suppression protein
VIERFRHKGLERLFTTGNASGVAPAQVRRLVLILAQLNVAHNPVMMDAPGLRFHALKGDRKGQYAVSVSGNWRIVFEFDGEDATEVDLVDYH